MAEFLAEAIKAIDRGALSTAKDYIRGATLASSRVPEGAFDEPEPEWFPNEGDRQWWREKHRIPAPPKEPTR